MFGQIHCCRYHCELHYAHAQTATLIFGNFSSSIASERCTRRFFPHTIFSFSSSLPSTQKKLTHNTLKNSSDLTNIHTLMYVLGFYFPSCSIVFLWSTLSYTNKNALRTVHWSIWFSQLVYSTVLEKKQMSWLAIQMALRRSLVCTPNWPFARETAVGRSVAWESF